MHTCKWIRPWVSIFIAGAAAGDPLHPVSQVGSTYASAYSLRLAVGSACPVCDCCGREGHIHRALRNVIAARLRTRANP